MLTTVETRPGIELVSPVFGAVNDESWLITLSRLPNSKSSDLHTAGQVLAELREAGAYEDTVIPEVRVLWKKLEDGVRFGITEHEHGGFRRSLLGDVVCGMGGHIIEIATDCNVSTRHLIGDSPDRNGYRDPVTTQLGIWHAFISRPLGRVLNADILDEMEESGFKRRGVALALAGLAESGMLYREERTSNQARKRLGFRLGDDVLKHKLPRTAVARYLDTIRPLVELDIDFFNEGTAKLERIIDKQISRKTLSLYFVRAAVSNPHFGLAAKLKSSESVD